MADYGQSGGPNTSADAEALLRPLVTCGICMELYVDPVALLNCLHLACGSCAVDWLERSSTCHQCRENVRGTRDSHHTADVVEVYRKIAPNSGLVAARSPQELLTLREKYRPGQGVTTQNESDSDEDEQSSSASGSVDGWQQSAAFNLVTGVPRTPEFRWAAGSQIRLENDCLSCDPNNTTGYVCPHPCPPADTEARRHTVPFGHTICARCARYLPLRGDRNSKCTVCTRTTCEETGQSCRTAGPRIIELSVLRDVTFSPSRSLPLTRPFGDNEYESGIFDSYATRQNLNIQDLFSQILAMRAPNGLPTAPWHGRRSGSTGASVVGLDEKVCQDCASDLVEASMFDWWLSKRSNAGLSAEVLSRPDCWYGIECRTARHNITHAQGLNHICRSTRADTTEDRGQHETPEGGNRFVADSGSLSHTFPAFSPSAVQFLDKGGEAVFLCSSIHRGDRGTMTIPGKTTMWRSEVKVYFGLGGEEHEHDGVVQVLVDTRDMRWVRTSKGVVPTGCRPVVGGHGTFDGSNRELYHCAVWWQGQRVPGCTSEWMGRAAITWGGSMWYFEDDYEILCWV
ncbi:hypothetical protein BDV93DRAFT_91127 [Ceratobasidium sp. AG-I]|nr:hypothetical protein BDV93DRAFT_91127 [Ceratobasidium sp. AG-I]